MRASELWPRWEVSHPMPNSSAEGSPFTGEGLLWGQACQCHASQPVLTPGGWSQQRLNHNSSTLMDTSL